MDRATRLGAFLASAQRCSQLDNLYLVSISTADAFPFFEDFLAGRLLVDILRQQQHRADTWAYVIMPDQLDWLFELKPGMSRYKLIEKVLSVSTVVLNEYFCRKGVFWRSEYTVQRLSSEAEALTTARGLVARLSRQGLAKSVASYPLWDARHWL